MKKIALETAIKQIENNSVKVYHEVRREVDEILNHLQVQSR